MKVNPFYTALFIFLALLTACQGSGEKTQSANEDPEIPEVVLDKLKMAEKKAGLGFLAIRKEALEEGFSEFPMYADAQLQYPMERFDYKKADQYPNIQAEFYNLKKDICYFTCLGYNRKVYTIMSNKQDWERRYVPLDTTKYRFIHWSEFLKSTKTVERLDSLFIPVRVMPKIQAAVVAWEDSTQMQFTVKGYDEKFLKIEDPKTKQEGWLQWVSFDKLLLKIQPQDVLPISEMTLEKDRVLNLFPENTNK